MHNLINRKAFCQEARAYSVEKYFKIFARERKESATPNEAAVFSLVVCQIQLYFLLYLLALFLLPFLSAFSPTHKAEGGKNCC